MSITITDQDRKDLLNVLKEVSNSMTRVDAEKDFIRDAIKDASDKFQINKRILRKMAKVYHRNSFTDEISEAEEFQSVYETVVAS